MKHSIKRQMAVMFIGLMAAVLLAHWLINTFFLESYYIIEKKQVLINVYEVVNKVTDVDGYSDEGFMDTLNGICLPNNITIVLMDEEYQPVVGTLDSKALKAMRARLWTYIVGEPEDVESEVIAKTDDYVIQKIREGYNNTDYLEGWGTLNTGYFFIMQLPLESIRDSVQISTEFLTYFSIIGIVLSIVLILWISNKITKPIKELTDLSKKMADLNFGVKYTSGGDNEIGQLGSHFNTMSETLETVISELKTANNELLKDNERKTQIDEMRKEFLSNVSHELKTPIALIQGYAEGLKECINDDAESRDFYCEVIMDEAGKMNQMVKKLLTLNQLEFGADTVNMERFDIVTLIRGVILSASILAQQKGAKIIFQEKGPIYVWGDEFKVEEVVTNYVSNALNHVDFDRMIEVKVVTGEGKARISVFNTGRPIPEEDLDKIWIKFYKVDKARTREYGGSGIGLSIVKAIIDSFHQQCGAINYENGVEFWFTLDAKE